MGQVLFDISISLDGFVAGPNDEIDPLHDWLYGLESWREPHGLEGGEASPDSEVLKSVFGRAGAIVIGRRMYDLTNGWGEDPPFRMPVFVLTNRGQDDLPRGETTFSFVTGGPEEALARARAAAGGRDVLVGGGASTIQQFLRAGLIDELHVHLVPVLLGEGIRLFDGLGATRVDLKRTAVTGSPGVTHLTFEVSR